MRPENRCISPSITLEDIYGPNSIYNSRASVSAFEWVFPDLPMLEAFTGNQQTIMGRMPMICNSSVSTPEGLDLLQQAGLQAALRRYTYFSQEDFQKLLAQLLPSPYTFVVQHVYPPAELPAHKYWISPELLSFLNNKAHLTDFVPTEYVARRAVVETATITEKLFPSLPFPWVIKAVSDHSSGAGTAVMICSSADELQAAKEYFHICQQVVVEEFVTVKRNLCVQFATTQQGGIQYLGAAEQVTDGQGHYLGSWLDQDVKPSERMLQVGRHIMEKAVALGYKGVAGFDIVLLSDDRVVVLDLNFRVNGSTAAVLLQRGTMEAYGVSTLLYNSWEWHGAIGRRIALAQQFIQQGYFVPLSFYNAEAGPYPNSASMLVGIVIGQSREEVAARNEQFTKELASAPSIL
ncbi:MAG: ATP-grasp domain-containing protein [Ktedonobacteraceae bacterium]|nr:ATP-grasp domain-containing protein [Ktedonobacteraceae bacterium]